MYKLIQFRCFVLLLYGVLILSKSDIYSQYSISGTIYDYSTKEPLKDVSVYEEISDKWVFSNAKGNFDLSIANKYNVSFSLLGKQIEFIEGTTTKNISQLKIYLKNKTLELEEVIVIAKSKKDKTASSVVFDKYAISQVQGFSLAQVLQQLPNLQIKPVYLNSPQKIALRTAINTENNRFGVSFILDDMPLSNDESMDKYGPREVGRMPHSNINDGYDLRQIPASNIESIEVIGGIPDAKYGNATSGIIKIERKAGVSKYNISTQLNGGAIGTSINKGFRINDKLGNISLSLNYLKANADPRNNLANFNRITGSGIWSSSYKNKYKNTFSFTLNSNIDKLNVDKEFDNGFQRANYKKNRGLILSNKGHLSLDYKLIDFLKFQIGISKNKSDSYIQEFINSGGKVVPIALDNKLTNGVYTPVAYLSKRFIYSEPYYINTNISIGKNIKYENLSQRISTGVNFKYSNNIGKGRVLDPSSVSTHNSIIGNGSSGEGVRPLDYGKYVIPRKLFGAYLQDNISYAFKNKSKLHTNIGLRYDNQNSNSSFAPRINTAYEINKKIKIRVATGFLSKAPSLANLFPGDKYYDILIRDIRTNNYSYNLLQTFVKRVPINPLKPSKVWKYELGTDLNLKFGNLKITSYYNKMYDGFNSTKIQEVYKLPKVKFEFPNGTDNQPTYSVTGYNNFPITYKLSTNGLSSTDKGIEVFTNFKKIKSINTAFSLVGNYTRTKITYSTPRIKPTENPLETEFVYVYYNEKPEIKEALNTRLITTYHNSKLRLLVSLTSEFMVFSKRFATVTDIYPYAYKNINLEYKSIPENVKTDEKYSSLRLDPSKAEDVKRPCYTNFHLRITKEMLNGLSFSLYATNFLNYKPKIEVNNVKISPNVDISFGGSFKYNF